MTYISPNTQLKFLKFLHLPSKSFHKVKYFFDMDNQYLYFRIITYVSTNIQNIVWLRKKKGWIRDLIRKIKLNHMIKVQNDYLRTFWPFKWTFIWCRCFNKVHILFYRNREATGITNKKFVERSTYCNIGEGLIIDRHRPQICQLTRFQLWINWIQVGCH